MGRKRLTTEEFIEKARKVHGDKYGYDEVEYKNYETKVKIYCRSCKKYFWQSPHDHLKGHGCRNCFILIKSSATEGFIVKAKLIHGEKYGYNEVNYTKRTQKIKIFCNICKQYFWQTPFHHLKGCGCPNCGKVSSANHRKDTTEKFVEKARKIHGDKYDYDKVIYHNSRTKVEIFCKSCGKYFYQFPSNHLSGRGCPDCGNVLRAKSYTYTTKKFIEKARKVHGNRYSYESVTYEKNNKLVQIYCTKCRRYFLQMPCSHLQGIGCPYCKSSKIELLTFNFLKSHNISFVQEYSMQNFNKSYRKLRLDFYIPQLKVGIECQGEQHFHPVDFTNKMTIEETQKQFEQIQFRDRIKKQYCDENGIKLYYMTKKEDLQDLYERRLIY